MHYICDNCDELLKVISSNLESTNCVNNTFEFQGDYLKGNALSNHSNIYYISQKYPNMVLSFDTTTSIQGTITVLFYEVIKGSFNIDETFGIQDFPLNTMNELLNVFLGEW